MSMDLDACANDPVHDVLDMGRQVTWYSVKHLDPLASKTGCRAVGP